MLSLMYITNRPEIARIAESAGVDRIFVDMEYIGKSDRQGGMDTVQLHHTVDDVKKISEALTRAEVLVRVNPIHEETESYSSSKAEINDVINNGADIVMLPFFKTAEEVKKFVDIVNGRAKTMLLVETPEAVSVIDDILKIDGIDSLHIGLNDLSLGYGKKFMFEILADGTVEMLCKKFKKAKIPYGFGGIAAIGKGTVPAEMIVKEHYRIGSDCAILSRSFCDADKVGDIDLISRIFKDGIKEIRNLENECKCGNEHYFTNNRAELIKSVEKVVSGMRKDMKINAEVLNDIKNTYGDAFYLLDSEQFEKNYKELESVFKSVYSKFNIAYSYKTNYTPKLCRIVNELGGFAEVVSDMEMEIALRVGAAPENIIWNGPFKNAANVEKLLVMGGTVNIDSEYEVDMIAEIAKKYPQNTLNVGIRCNFDVNDGVVSRFGFDIETDEFKNALALFDKYNNLHLIGLQCHFATRSLETWKPRAEGMLRLVDELGIVPEHIDLGGGLFGKMADSLKKQFNSEIPTYKEYAAEVAPVFAEHFKNLPEDEKPMLIIEPGSALVGDCMKFASKVVNIKEVRGKAIATLLGSIYNINPTLNKKNPPIEVYSMGGEQKKYDDLDFGGFTCIESDYLYRNFKGSLAKGDMVVFGNAGSYSIVLKPPFILPNFPILDICSGKAELIKRAESFDDLFHTYSF